MDAVRTPLVQAKAGEGSGNGLCEHRDSPIGALGIQPSGVIPSAPVGRTQGDRLVEIP